MGESSEGRACRWIVVADSPFLPPRDGGEREHAGFLDAAVDAGRVAALVVPAATAVDLAVYRSAAGGAPVVVVPRDMRPHHALHRRVPYVVATRPAPAGLATRLARVAPDTDGVVLFSSKARLVGAALGDGLGLPVVLRGHNLEGPYHRALAADTRGPRGLLMRREAARIDVDERALEASGALAGIADISGVDAGVRAARTSTPVRHVPSFALGADTSGPPAGPRPDGGPVLFLGALSVPLNRAGLVWFTDHVWPRLHGSVPGARLEVVGSGCPPSLAAHLSSVPGATLHADVPDTGPFLARAAVGLAPTLTGSGVNIKLVEYLRANLPTVTTPAAAAAIGLRDGEHLLVAREPGAFADAVRAVLLDPAGAARRAERGRARLVESLDPRKGIAAFDALFAGAATPSAPCETGT